MPLYRRSRLISVLLATALIAPLAAAQDAQPTPQPEKAAEKADHSLYLRVTEERGRRVSLEVAVREFVRTDEEGPRVALVSVAHIGDREMYQQIQKVLGEYDIVLYEAVTPAGVGRPGGETDEEKAKSTKQALRFIASIAEAHRAKHGRYPKDAGELKKSIHDIDAIAVNWLKDAMTDAWGNPIVYESKDDGEGYRIVSFGADGAPGSPDGEDAGADITVDHETGVRPFEIERDNIQQQLATALGLSYQMAELDYTAPNWRNSDMNMAELNAAFRDRDVDLAVMDTMEGVGFPAALGKMFLGLITALDRMMEGAVSDMVKVMMIELLGDQSLIEDAMGHMGGGFSEVLIDLRNKVTINDLEAIMRDEPEVKSVAIFYGAAHMPDFAERLAGLGFEPVAYHWIPAITVDITASRLDPRQVQQMRMMMRRMLRQQMQQMRQMQGR